MLQTPDHPVRLVLPVLARVKPDGRCTCGEKVVVPAKGASEKGLRRIRSSVVMMADDKTTALRAQCPGCRRMLQIG